MELKPSDVEKFQRIYKDKFGISLDLGAAELKLTILVNQLVVLTEAITDEHHTALDVVLKNENENDYNDETKTE
jgi:hypothetical protein